MISSRAFPRLFIAALIAAIVARCWLSFCFFPLSGWNATRLAPSFMLDAGITPYPGFGDAPITTWIYGPVPLFLMLPATWSHDTSAALLIAGAINLLIAAIPVAAVLFARPANATTTRIDCLWAFLLCMAVWPNSSLQFLQPDNAAVAFGLLANHLLLRSSASRAHPPVLAAICTALAVWSKQTSIALVLAQCLWLALASGLRPALRHAIACAAAGIALCALFVGLFGIEALWLNLVQVPGRLPYWPDPFARTYGLLPHLLGYVVAPAALAIAARRTVWRRESPWLLPLLSWLCLLPMSLLSIYKTGGTANSLTGFLYLLPTAALALVRGLHRWRPPFAPVIAAVAAFAIVGTQLALSPLRPIRPMIEHLRQADYLARQFPGQIYFPWNPLVTFFVDGRFYHAEDGLYTRYTAGLAPPRAVAFRDLPARWSVTAYHSWPSGWGIIEQLEPQNAQRTQFGSWRLHSWTPQR